MKYEVLWIDLWKEFTRTLSIILFVTTSIVLLARFFNNNMSFEKTFEHLSVFQWPVLIVALSVSGAFIVAFLIRFTGVEIANNELIGRNYWFFKKRIPITAIKKIYSYSHSGLTVIVADGGVHGEVHISNHVEKLDELIGYLEKNASINNA